MTEQPYYEIHAKEGVVLLFYVPYLTLYGATSPAPSVRPFSFFRQASLDAKGWVYPENREMVPVVRDELLERGLLRD